MMLLGFRFDPPVGHKLENWNKESHLQNSSPLKLEGVELWYLVFSISLWTSTQFVHMMLLGSRFDPPRGGGHNLEHRNKENQLQNSSSLKPEGIELRFFTLCICLWTFIIYSYDSFGVKTDPTPGVTSWNIGTKKTNFKILFLWNRKG